MNKLSKEQILFGKDSTERIVNIEIKGNEAFIFQEDSKGVFFHKREFTPWIVSNTEDEFYFEELKGNNYYKYLKYFHDTDSYREAIEENKHYWTIYNYQESFMLKEGLTFFKGMELEDLSIMSFDIETTGFLDNEKSKLLIISSIYRKGSKLEKKIFSLDEYKTEIKLIEEWAKWVYDKDPSCIIGYNIYNFDFPFINKILEREGKSINIGRDKSTILKSNFNSKFRLNNGSILNYNLYKIFGREIVDMYFVAQRYDQEKKYENYKLKDIAKKEGINKRRRQYYDSSRIGEKWEDETERNKIKKYCLDDSDETLKLFDRMIPSFFDFTRFISLPFSQYINRSPTSLMNNLMTRAYLHNNYSLPRKTFVQEDYLKGGKNIGNIGVFNNALKIDVSSLYMSIVKAYQLYDEKKDPLKIFITIVDHMIDKRLDLKENKKKHKSLQNKDKMYKDFLNKGCYGFLATKGYLFNSPNLASEITERGRNILEKAILWADQNQLTLINADTDSISFCRKDEERISYVQQEEILNEFRKIFPQEIKWEIEEEYKKIMSLKSKNYVFVNNKDEIVKKGAILRSRNKENELQKIIDSIINTIFYSKDNNELNNKLLILYKEKVANIKNIKDISNWCKKKVITEKTLNAKGERFLKLINDNKLEQGDEIFYFNKNDNHLELLENFDGEYSEKKLLEKLNQTFLIFDEIVDFTVFPFIL